MGLVGGVALFIATTGRGSTDAAPTPTIVVRSASMAEVHVRTLEHAPASAVQNMMWAVVERNTHMFKQDMKIVADDRAGILTIVTRPENMTLLDRLIQVWDVEGRGYTNNLVKGCFADEGAPEPTSAGGPTHWVQPYVILVRHARATQVLEQMWTGQEFDSIRSGTKIIADNRSGTLVVLTYPENMALIERLLPAMDVEEGAPLNNPVKAVSTTTDQQGAPYSEPAERAP